MHAKPPTITDVATRSGFSNATISRYLNGMDSVSADAQAAISQAIEELGYVPSAAARGLAARATSMLGLCVPRSWAAASLGDDHTPSLTYDFGQRAQSQRCDSSITEIMRGVEHAAWEAQRALWIVVADDFEFSGRVRDLIARVDGLVVLADALPAEVITYVSERIPVVLVSGSSHPNVRDYVDCDSATAMELLAHHILAAHGPSHVMYVSQRSSTLSSSEKEAGLQRTLASGASHIALSSYTADSTVEAGTALAAEISPQVIAGQFGDLPAFVCANDDVAVGLIAGFIEAGIDFPRQALVTGFDECRVSATTRPRLTTVRTPTAALGVLAVSALLERIAHPAGPDQSLSSRAHVVVRDSCGIHNDPSPK